MARPSLIRTLIVGSPENAVTAEIAFSPDSRMLAASDGSTDEHKMTLWDIADPRQTYPIGYLPTRAGVTSIAFAPDGRTLVAGIWDKAELLRWDITDRAQVRNLEPLTVDRSRRVFVAEVFSPDGRLLATAVDGATVILWRISGPGRVEMIEELSGHAEGAEAIAFSPDGHTLATGGIDGTVVLWDITDSREPSRLGRMKTSPVLALTLRSEGEELVTSTSDDYVNQWDLTELSTLRDHAVELACQEVGRSLTPDEWAQFAPSLPYEQTCV